MSDKPFKNLNELDQVIRTTVSTTSEAKIGEEGTLLTIAFISGFEKFNTRPFHNYETWGNGYRVEGRGVVVEREDLDDAIQEWGSKAIEEYVSA